MLPMIAVTGAALTLTACAADFAACPWTLRLAVSLLAVLIAAAPAYWFGPRAEAALGQRLADGVRAALRDHERGSLAGHEIKTPLTGIKAYLELLADGDADDDATRAEFLAGISSQVERLEWTIDELLGSSSGRVAHVCPPSPAAPAAGTSNVRPPVPTESANATALSGEKAKIKHL